VKVTCPDCGHVTHVGGEFRVAYKVHTHDHGERTIFKHFRKRQDAEAFVASLERHHALDVRIDVRPVGDWTPAERSPA
jgi:hypothetical protein